MASIIGQMAVFSKEISKMASAMGMECGNEVQANPTNMKVSMQMTRNVATASSPGRVATHTKETTSTMLDMALVKCTGMMEAATREIGNEESNTDKVRTSHNVGEIQMPGEEAKRGIF